MVDKTKLPAYRSHKIVHACKIAELKSHGEGADHGATVVPAEASIEPFEIDGAFIRKHRPQVGGYFVVYDGGYQSWSPADAFETGYTLVDNQEGGEAQPETFTGQDTSPANTVEPIQQKPAPDIEF